ncbi:MAG TPA: PIG-L family deacetylase [Capsulimonadaceae bacterium]|nr:PIG-L family deacetylase [Capsulimonadaceae bacterium]
MTSALIAPPILLLFLLLAQAYRIYAHNRAADAYRFQAITAPTPPHAILVVSPHPDDESLGASGLMQEAMKNGCQVHVVFLTCGDSFRVGVASYYHKLRVQPADYVRYGMMRQNEARAALGAIGLPPDHVTFLGYPDQGLLPIWQQHWSPADPYTSPYSHASSVPYSDAAAPGAPYCGQAIVRDLVAQIERDRPTDIYVTHPNDDHPDHETAAAYVDLAVTELKESGESWAQQMAVHYFLVHRGDWPVPQGLNVAAPLAPPAPMIRLDTMWRSLPVPPAMATAKEHSLAQYQSQEEVMGRFLSSFVRKNEMFGQIGDQFSYLPVVPSGAVQINGDAGVWPYMEPSVLDPEGDTILRDFQAGADITAVYACSDKKALYLRMDTRGEIEEQMHYLFNVRCIDDSGQSPDKSLTVSFAPRLTPAGEPVQLKGGITGAWQDHTVEVSIPLSRLGTPKSGLIFLEGRSKLTGLTIDHTGIREIRVNFSNTLPQTPLS